MSHLIEILSRVVQALSADAERPTSGASVAFSTALLGLGKPLLWLSVDAGGLGRLFEPMKPEQFGRPQPPSDNLSLSDDTPVVLERDVKGLMDVADRSG